MAETLPHNDASCALQIAKRSSKNVFGRGMKALASLGALWETVRHSDDTLGQDDKNHAGEHRPTAAAGGSPTGVLHEHRGRWAADHSGYSWRWMGARRSSIRSQ